MSKRTIGSLFSGGGGWDAGAIDAGLEPVFAVEYEPWIAKWHSRVFGNHVWQGSVADVDYQEIARKVGGHVDVLVSSPPCQATSNSGKQGAKRREDLGLPPKDTSVCDPNVGIYTLDAVDALKPSVVFLENNENYERGTTFKRIVAGLGQRGYSVQWRVLKAEEHGVPSGRKRLIMCAVAPDYAHVWPTKQPPVPWYDAISDLIPHMAKDELAGWQKKALVDNPPPANTPVLIAGGNPNRNSRGYVVHRLPHQQAWATQLAKNTSGMRVIDENGVCRRLSAHGVARLQGFPDWYPIDSLDRSKAIHILGNSVPAKLATELLAPYA